MDEHNTFISKDSSFDGDISAEHIVVAGTVTGNLRASSAIVIQKGGRVTGDIHAPKIYIANECSHDGLLCLGDPAQPAPDKIDVGSSISESVDVETESENEPPKTPPVSKKKKNKLW